MKKKNKLMIIMAILFCIAALVFVVLGFALAGADILGWFTSKWAYMFYIVGAIWLFIIIFLFFDARIKKL